MEPDLLDILFIYIFHFSDVINIKIPCPCARIVKNEVGLNQVYFISQGRPVAKGGHFGGRAPPAEVECPSRWMSPAECSPLSAPPLKSPRWVPPAECPPPSAPSPPTTARGIRKTSPTTPPRIRKTSPTTPPRIRKTAPTTPSPRIRKTSPTPPLEFVKLRRLPLPSNS